MSHLKERKEQSCLNCNAVVNGKYCSVCGQENLEPQESLWHLIVHFFNDITHFDGKFFSSVKYVVTKPGFLTSEYVRGRRMSYLNPVRFYVFTSFLFFLIFFAFILNMNAFIKEDENTELSKKSSDEVDAVFSNLGIDSLKALGLTKETGLKKLFIEKGFKISEKYDNNSSKTTEAFLDILFHSIPQTLFFSLPFFALVLQLLYFRRKHFYYVSHIIFTIHLYIFIYIDLLLMYFFGVLSQIKYLRWLGTVEVILGIGILYYTYRALRNFYEQGRWKTVLKLFLLCFALMFLSIIFLMIAFTLSLYKM